MNSSEYEFLKPQILNYLGFRGADGDPGVEEMIKACLKEVEEAAQFNCLYKFFDAPPEFLNAEPYREFLLDSKGVIVTASTLGISADRLVKRLFVSDPAKAAVADCCASAYIEFLSNRFEKTLGDDLSYRFCPGYGGSSVNDIKYIFDILHPEKIGMELTPSMFMLPSKSLAGVIAVGKRAEKSCRDCFMAKSCHYLKEGKRCYA